MKTLLTSALLAVPVLSPETGCCAPPGAAEERVLTVELLALDLKTCGRCIDTATHLEEAVRRAQCALAPAGVEVRLKKTVVTSEQEAEALRFVSSPTVRIDGVDVQSAAKETACGECTDLAGGGCGINCRVWPWRGTDHEAAPVGLLVEAILRKAFGTGESGAAVAGFNGVPENLRKFFRSRNEQSEKDTEGRDRCCDSTCCS